MHCEKHLFKSKSYLKYFSISSLILAAVFLCFSFPQTALAVPPYTEITSCQTISVAGTYVLINDMATYSGTCITVQVDGVVIDGNGYTIDANGGGAVYATGDFAHLNGYNLTIKNLRTNGHIYAQGYDYTGQNTNTGANGGNGADLTITNSYIDNASVIASGGGGDNGNNGQPGGGGGNGGSVTITNSTVSGSVYSNGGGGGPGGQGETDPFSGTGYTGAGGGSPGAGGTVALHASTVIGTVYVVGGNGGSGGTGGAGSNGLPGQDNSGAGYQVDGGNGQSGGMGGNGGNGVSGGNGGSVAVVSSVVNPGENGVVYYGGGSPGSGGGVGPGGQGGDGGAPGCDESFFCGAYGASGASGLSGEIAGSAGGSYGSAGSANFSGNSSGDAAPVFQSVSINRNVLTLTYDDVLLKSGVSPIPGEIGIDGATHDCAASSVVISGATVVATLGCSVDIGEEVFMGYPGSWIEDMAGHSAAGLDSQAVTNASAARTLYYYNATNDGNWNTDGNWWFDSGHSVPTTVPLNGDTVYVDGDLNTGPSSPVTLATLYVAQNAPTNMSTSNHIIVSGSALIGDTAQSRRGVVTGDLTVGGIQFNADSYFQGTISGNAAFSSTSYIPFGSTVTENATFSGSSYNSGTVSGYAEFNDTSHNEGSVGGQAQFFGDSTENNGSVSGTTTRRYTSSATVTRNFVTTGPWTVVADGAGVVVDVSGATYDNTTTFLEENGGTFKYTAGVIGHYYNGGVDYDWNSLSNWYGDAELSIPATVLPGISDDVYIYAPVTSNGGAPASVHSMTFYDGGAGYEFGIPITVANGATFNGASYNSNTLDGNAVFNGTSHNTGTITGNTTFNTTYYNASAPADGVFTIAGGTTWEGAVQGTVYGSDELPITDYIFEGTSFNQGTIAGDARFNASAYDKDPVGTVNGNVFFSSDVTFTLSGGSAWGRDSSVWSFDGTKNWVFNDSSQNIGTIPGDAVFNGDSSENSGTVTGTKTRRYISSATVTRAFSNGPWNVIADGSDVVVDVSGASYSTDPALLDYASFSEMNGGHFVYTPLDTTPPYVSSIVRYNPTDQFANPTNPVFRVTFDSDVSGVDLSDFTLNTSGGVTANLTNVTQVSASVYDVSVNASGSENGVLRLDLKSSETGIKDTADNAIAGGFTSGEIYSYSGASDTTPPAAPGSFSSSVSGGTTVDLSWTNPTDIDFSAVAIRRSTSGFPASISSNTSVLSGSVETSYSDTNIPGDGTYYYSIFATDSSGNVSTAAHTTAIVDTAPPHILSATVDGSLLTITFNEAIVHNSPNLYNYLVHRGQGGEYPQAASPTVDGSTVTLTLNAPVISTDVVTFDYSADFDVHTKDLAGNELGATSSVAVTNLTAPDTTPPDITLDTPTNNSYIGGNSVSLTATASDNVAVSGVNFYIDGALIGEEDTTDPYTATLDTTQYSEDTYQIKAVARDTSGNYATSTISTVTIDHTAPHVSITGSYGWGGWAPSVNWGDAGVCYSSLDNGNSFSTLDCSQNGADIPSPQADQHTLIVRGVDAAGNEDTDSSTFDNIPPYVTSIVRYDPTGEFNSPRLPVFRVTFDSDVSGVDASDFSFYTTGNLIAGSIPNVTKISDAIYDVSVDSDVTGNDGTLRLDLRNSGTSIVDTTNGNAISGGFNEGEIYTYIPDTTPPATPTDFTGTPSGNDVHLTWTNPVDSDFSSVTILGSTSGYLTDINGGGAVVTGLVSTSWDVSGLSENTYYYTIFALDGAGNASTPAELTFTIDTTAPVVSITAPINQSNITTFSPAVSWGNSTVCEYKYDSDDYAGLTCSSNGSDIPAPSLGEHTLYVRGSDAASNVTLENVSFTYSSIPNPDTTPPSAPSDFTASTSGSTISLSWTNPVDSDFSNVTVRRSTSAYPTSITDGTAVVSDSTGTSYLDTSLSDATYYYSIFAKDTTGNVSSSSHASSTVSTASHNSDGGNVAIVTVRNTGGGGGTAVYGCTDRNATNFTVGVVSDSNQCRYSSAVASSTSKSLIDNVIKPQVNKPLFIFTRNLYKGMKGKDVTELQKYLIAQNAGPFAKKLAKNGTSTLFGALTESALKEFQKINKILPATGAFGPKTRAIIK